MWYICLKNYKNSCHLIFCWSTNRCIGKFGSESFIFTWLFYRWWYRWYIYSCIWGIIKDHNRNTSLMCHHRHFCSCSPSRMSTKLRFFFPFWDWWCAYFFVWKSKFTIYLLFCILHYFPLPAYYSIMSVACGLYMFMGPHKHFRAALKTQTEQTPSSLIHCIAYSVMKLTKGFHAQRHA